MIKYEDIEVCVLKAFFGPKYYKLNSMVQHRIGVIRDMFDLNSKDIYSMVGAYSMKLLAKLETIEKEKYDNERKLQIWVSFQLVSMLGMEIGRAITIKNGTGKHYLATDINFINDDGEEQDFLENYVADENYKRPDNMLEYKQLLELVEEYMEPDQVDILLGNYDSIVEAANTAGVPYSEYFKKFDKNRERLRIRLRKEGYEL